VIQEDRLRIVNLRNWQHPIVHSAVSLVPASCTYVQPVVLLVVRKDECAVKEEQRERGP